MSIMSKLERLDGNSILSSVHFFDNFDYSICKKRALSLTFAFYDLETTGLWPEYNQPLQFAAILTDDDFNVLEKVNIRCRLSKHILPSPYALSLIHI